MDHQHVLRKAVFQKFLPQWLYCSGKHGRVASSRLLGAIMLGLCVSLQCGCLTSSLWNKLEAGAAGEEGGFYQHALLHLGFERNEDNVSFYWDNKGSGSIVPIPLTLHYHGGGVLPLSRWNENFSTEIISDVLVWKWHWDEGLDPDGI